MLPGMYNKVILSHWCLWNFSVHSLLQQRLSTWNRNKHTIFPPSFPSLPCCLLCFTASSLSVLSFLVINYWPEWHSLCAHTVCICTNAGTHTGTDDDDDARQSEYSTLSGQSQIAGLDTYILTVLLSNKVLQRLSRVYPSSHTITLLRISSHVNY